jgi:MFS family permease
VSSAAVPTLSSPGADRRWSDLRTLGPWFAVEFLNSWACTLLTAACYDYADKVLDVRASAALWLCMFWGVSYIPIALGAGKVSERVGPLRSASFFSGMSILTALLCLLAIGFKSIWMLAAVMLPYNLFCTPIWVAIESGLTRTQGKMRLSTRLGLFNIAWGSANFVAFFFRGMLEHISWSLIFIVPALLHVVAFLALRFWAPPADLIGTEHVPDDPAGGHELDAPGMRERARVLLHMAWLGNALCYVAIYVLIPLLAKLADLASIGTLVGAGMITSAWSLTRFGGFALAWLWSGWHYKGRWVLGAQIVAVACFFVILTIHSPFVFVGAQIFFGVAVALVYSAALYYAMHVSAGHGGHAGIHEALVGVGVALGPGLGAVASTGEFGAAAMLRVAVAVTGLLAVGTAVMGWQAWRAARAPLFPAPPASGDSPSHESPATMPPSHPTPS